MPESKRRRFRPVLKFPFAPAASSSRAVCKRLHILQSESRASGRPLRSGDRRRICCRLPIRFCRLCQKNVHRKGTAPHISRRKCSGARYGQFQIRERYNSFCISLLCKRDKYGRAAFDRHDFFGVGANHANGGFLRSEIGLGALFRVISERSFSRSLSAKRPCFEPTKMENGPLISAPEYVARRAVNTSCAFFRHAVNDLPLGRGQNARGGVEAKPLPAYQQVKR